MDCTEFQAIVAGEREEDLSQAESLGFETHLDGCATCREAVSRAEEDLERLQQLADPPPVSASAWLRVDEAVRVEARKKPGREDPFAPLVLVLEAAAAVAAPPELHRGALTGRPELVQPAMPVTLASRAASPAQRGRPLLAFVACAAAAVIAVVFALAKPVEPRTPSGSNNSETVLNVKPPEPGDVEYLDMKVGPSFKKLEKQGTLINLGGE